MTNDIICMVLASIIISIILGIETVNALYILELRSTVNSIAKHLDCNLGHKIITSTSDIEKYKDKGVMISISKRARKYIDENGAESERQLEILSDEIYRKYKDKIGTGKLESKWIDLVDGKLVVTDIPDDKSEERELIKQLSEMDLEGFEDALDTMSTDDFLEFEEKLRSIEESENLPIEDCKYVLNKYNELVEIKKQLDAESGDQDD